MALGSDLSADWCLAGNGMGDHHLHSGDYGISGELYEAAMIDGANRWQRMKSITLPGIKGTVVTLLIMNLGRIMGSNFEDWMCSEIHR